MMALLRERDPLVQDVVEGCIDAYTACKETIAYSLEAGEPFSDGRFIVTLLCCSDTCRTTGEFVIVEAELIEDSCRFCALVCERCAVRCDQMPDDEQMQLCAETLRRNVAACEAILGTGFWDRDGRPAR